MKSVKVTLLLTLFLLSAGMGYGQYLQVSATFMGAPQKISLQDIDLTSSGGQPLFTLQLTNSDSVNKKAEAKLYIEIIMDGNSGSEVLASGSTRPFNLYFGQPINISDKNLDSELDLQDFSVETGTKDILSQILATGFLPDGVYTFKFRLTGNILPPGGEPIPDQGSETEISLNIRNTTTIELVYPGRPADQGDLPVVYSSQPTFLWSGNAAQYTIMVAMRDENNEDQSPEDAIRTGEEGITLWTKDNVSGNTIPYSTNPPLKSGATYFWQVKTNINLANNRFEEFASEIWGFKYQEPASQSGPMQDDVKENYFVSMFSGIEGMGDIIDNLIGQGYQVDTGNMKYKGSKMNLAGLQILIGLIKSGEIELVPFGDGNLYQIR
ncbi:MAG TPA: hypothetical protein ENH29_05285 [Bacteroidetes bacterium]|nr:hypothetical protein [Bacteroidota bacterium]